LITKGRKSAYIVCVKRSVSIKILKPDGITSNMVKPAGRTITDGNLAWCFFMGEGTWHIMVTSPIFPEGSGGIQ
jgi:hypothetical protein